MPRHNHFRHQAYDVAPPADAVHQLTASPPPLLASDEYGRRMREVGKVLRDANVTAIYLVHGTFVGEDALGWFRKVARIVPSLGESLRRMGKQVIDKIAKDAGNFTAEYAAEFQHALQAEIPVRLFNWSGENHHVGRADGAVRLLDELSRQKQPGRILLLGHSHGGNVFALVTNLLGGDLASREAFFAAARPYCLGGEQPHWRRVEEWLARPDNPLTHLQLDLVTLGTPLRYGWDTGGCAKLLHVVNHRPLPGVPPTQAAFPPRVEDLLTVAGGDYVQQIGIAGTNLAPDVLAWRTWAAELGLTRLLQAGVSSRRLFEHLRAGRRAADDGTVLLVDYGPQPLGITQHVFGHAVYTRTDWLLFHAELIAKWCYGECLTLA